MAAWVDGSRGSTARAKASSSAMPSPAICRSARSRKARAADPAAAAGRYRSTSQQGVDLPGELRAGEGLDEIGRGAHFLGRRAVLGKSARAHDQHRNIAKLGHAADVLAEIEAGHLGQHEIETDDVGHLVRQLPQSGASVRRFDGGDAHRLQIGGDHPAQRRIVLDDESTGQTLHSPPGVLRDRVRGPCYSTTTTSPLWIRNELARLSRRESNSKLNRMRTGFGSRRTTKIRSLCASSVRPPALARSCSTPVPASTWYPPCFATSPSTETITGRVSSSETVTTGTLMNSLSLTCSSLAKEFGEWPAAVTSLRKGSETLPSLRTFARADIPSWLKTRICSTSPGLITYSFSTGAGASGQSLTQVYWPRCAH